MPYSRTPTLSYPDFGTMSTCQVKGHFTCMIQLVYITGMKQCATSGTFIYIVMCAYMGNRWSIQRETMWNRVHACLLWAALNYVTSLELIKWTWVPLRPFTNRRIYFFCDIFVLMSFAFWSGLHWENSFVKSTKIFFWYLCKKILFLCQQNIFLYQSNFGYLR